MYDPTIHTPMCMIQWNSSIKATPFGEFLWTLMSGGNYCFFYLVKNNRQLLTRRKVNLTAIGVHSNFDGKHTTCYSHIWQYFDRTSHAIMYSNELFKACKWYIKFHQINMLSLIYFSIFICKITHYISWQLAQKVLKHENNIYPQNVKNVSYLQGR